MSSHMPSLWLGLWLGWGWRLWRLPLQWHTRLLAAATCRCRSRALPAARGCALLGEMGGSRSSRRALARRGGGARSLTPHCNRYATAAVHQGERLGIRISHASRQGEGEWKTAGSNISRPTSGRGREEGWRVESLASVTSEEGWGGRAEGWRFESSRLTLNGKKGEKSARYGHRARKPCGLWYTRTKPASHEWELERRVARRILP